MNNSITNREITLTNYEYYHFVNAEKELELFTTLIERSAALDQDGNPTLDWNFANKCMGIYELLYPTSYETLKDDLHARLEETTE